MSKKPYLSVRIFTLLLLSSTATAEIVNIQFSSTNSDLPNTSIIYTLLVGMAYTLTGTLALYWCANLYYYQWRYGSTLSGTLSLLFSPSGTKALMRQFVADAPKAHESLSTEARRVPVQGTPIPLISVFIAILRLGTIWNDLFLRK